MVIRIIYTVLTALLIGTGIALSISVAIAKKKNDLGNFVGSAEDFNVKLEYNEKRDNEQVF